ncbi:MAG TPA: adenylate/guanylate cyclase domain-containing protein [Acidimicrobiales bacterium]|nr:adenylate/guanylate cyclase domain-containing protein [Acidimicrobiales bacterium]
MSVLPAATAIADFTTTRPGYVDVMEQHVDTCFGPDGEGIAYATVGEGPVLVLAAWWTSHLELDWQNREFRSFIEALAENHTVVRYDRPGVGMSERVERPFDLETEVGYLEAVAEATGSSPVDLLGISCGGPPTVMLASRRPDLVRRLVFFGSYACGSKISDEPTRDALLTLVSANWGLGSQAFTGIFLPDADALAARRFTSSQRHTTTAEVATALLDLTFDMDVSDVAGRLDQPALVLHRTRDGAIPARLGEDLAERIPGASFQALEGRSHPPWAEHANEVTAAIGSFLTDGRAAQPVTRRLTSVVFLDIVDSTSTMAEMGDDAWRRRLDALHRSITEEATPRDGAVVKDTGDGAMLTFDLPGEAIAFADAIRTRAATLDLGIRVGVHTGEVELRGDDITGRTVVVSSRLCDLAPAAAIYVSSTTVDLVSGRGIATATVGVRDLKGLPDPVLVFEAEPMPAAQGAGDVPSFERRGEMWQIGFEGVDTTIRHSKGVADLATLCRSPGVDVDVVTLMDGPDTSVRSTGTDVLDRQAIEAYRSRLGELEDALDDADLAGDEALSRELDEERGAIIQQLRSATGLGHRSRRLGDDVERARKAVSGRIRDAISKIADTNSPLGGHLAEHVTTGRVCRYR